MKLCGFLCLQRRDHQSHPSTTIPELDPKGRQSVKDIRGLSLKKKRVGPSVIMVFQWIRAYYKKKRANVGLSTRNRADGKAFASWNPERLRLDTGAVFS